jgi:long-chain acyl-CoA synthetase
VAQSIIQTFEETVARRGNDPAARFRDRDGKWVTRTWSQMDKARKILAAGLFELGLQSRERVNVLSGTTYEWMLADLAIQSCGGETVPIYASLLPHEVEYVIADCGAVMVFVENKAQLDKIISARAKLPALRKVIVMSDETDGSDFTVAWSEVLQSGEAKVAETEAKLKERTRGLGPSDILTIIYTSGTTGMPKGVVLTHSAMLYEIEAVKKAGIINERDMQLLFLPMAHVFAKVLQCTWFGTGHEMAIDGDVQKVADNIHETRPTVVASVPRIFEKVYSKVVSQGLESPGLRGKLFKWALDVNEQYAQLMLENKPIPFGVDVQLGLAKKLVFSKIHDKLAERFGGRLRFFVSGGAPLPKKMAYFFQSAGITILEGYGLTETSAATTVNRPEKNKIGTVGRALDGTEIKIAEDGEILIRGPGVMRDYWQREEATKEVFTPDGFFKTGDIGEIDPDGYLKITDRKKDIIVTAGGKNVAPQNLENLIKSASPLISQVVVHGDKRKYLTALITLEAEAAKKLSQDEARQAVQAVLDQANAQLASYETIKKFAILEKDFEVGQELTPSLKVKRKVVSDKYKALLDAFYDEKVIE